MDVEVAGNPYIDDVLMDEMTEFSPVQNERFVNDLMCNQKMMRDDYGKKMLDLKFLKPL